MSPLEMFVHDVSGESGAGKTESAKLIIKQIVNLCQGGASGSTLERKILEVCVLEVSCLTD